MLNIAFKEWAVICQALAQGRQALILRKGGIAEGRGGFALEHTRFWLFPTYTHQQRTGLKEEAAPLLDRAEAEQPPAGVVRLSHFAEVLGVYRVHSLPAALMLAGLHVWSEETVAKRFHYRTPGLYVLPVRVFRATDSLVLPNTPYYDGCKSWVEMERDLPTAGARQVLPEEALEELVWNLDLLLKPTAFA